MEPSPEATLDPTNVAVTAFGSPDGYRDFQRVVRSEYRYARAPEQEEFLRNVTATSHSRCSVLRAGYLLWRAQIGCDVLEYKQEKESFEVPSAYPPARMKPLAERSSEGRASPRGIPCLYLASTKETAVSEVRPGIGSYVSVAQFEIRKDLRIVDCSTREVGIEVRFFKKDWTPKEIEKQVWSDINRAFSDPVDRNDSNLEYIPTQIIAETLKLSGFDGIAYKSGYGEGAFNLALFDIATADVINCQLYRVENVSVTLSEHGNPYFVPK